MQTLNRSANIILAANTEDVTSYIDVLLLLNNTFSFCLQYFKVCTGNLYEDEKLNFLTVIQLLNEALRILRDECSQFDSENYLQPIVNMTKLQNKMLLYLEAVR